MLGSSNVIEVMIGGELSDDITTHQQPIGVQGDGNQSEIKVDSDH